MNKMTIKIDYKRFKNKNKQIEVLKNSMYGICLNRGFLEKLKPTQEKEIKEIQNIINIIEKGLKNDINKKRN